MKSVEKDISLKEWFAPFRKGIMGVDLKFETPQGNMPLIYADWTASGRLYQPIEEFMCNEIAPFVGNTHTETTVTGSSMTMAYHHSKQLIKQFIGAHESDVLISSNSGMTGVVNKFQRILGLKIHEKYRSQVQLPVGERPLIIVTHMEHHSNQTSWLETLGEVVVIPHKSAGEVDLEALEQIILKYQYRKVKIAAVTSCSNVTGIMTPYHEMARIMHRHDGLIFVDFACSAPYIHINMRPENEEEHLDALYFSPHKFLGGPGSSGILVFDPKLYSNRVPDNPGGGTVEWTNPWGEHQFIESIEAREDGGTPAFLQTIRVAKCFQLKDEMNIDKILAREEELSEKIWQGFDAIPNLHVLAGDFRDRLGVYSFFIKGLHYNLGVKLLNDRFGIQMRGGCSCAGTYGHFLLEVTKEYSHEITKFIKKGDLSYKPGWIRMSVHPTMTDDQIDYIMDALKQLAENFEDWGKEYQYDRHTNEFTFKGGDDFEKKLVERWF